MIDGMVAKPMSLSLAALRALPSRTQITRHDCVEGRSAIGQWTGAPLGLLLRAAGVSAAAKYAVFYCADNLDGEPSKGGSRRQVSITKASAWPTPSIRRPSSPMA